MSQFEPVQSNSHSTKNFKVRIENGTDCIKKGKEIGKSFNLKLCEKLEVSGKKQRKTPLYKLQKKDL